MRVLLPLEGGGEGCGKGCVRRVRFGFCPLEPQFTKVDHVCCSAKQITSRRYSRLPDSPTSRPRPKIAAEFEPRRRESAVSGALTQGIGSQSVCEAPPQPRWTSFRCAKPSVRVSRYQTARFASFSTWPPAADPHQHLTRRRHTSPTLLSITMAVVEPELFIKVFCVVMGMYGPPAASREVPSLLMMPARWRNPKATEQPVRRRTSAQASRCSPCPPRW
jgi:hypothetical protein